MNINIIGSENVNNEYLDMLSLNGFYSLINVHTRLQINKTHSCTYSRCYPNWHNRPLPNYFINSIVKI